MRLTLDELSVKGLGSEGWIPDCSLWEGDKWGWFIVIKILRWYACRLQIEKYYNLKRVIFPLFTWICMEHLSLWVHNSIEVLRKEGVNFMIPTLLKVDM